jgi:hypothetical protein
MRLTHNSDDTDMIETVLKYHAMQFRLASAKIMTWFERWMLGSSNFQLSVSYHIYTGKIQNHTYHSQIVASTVKETPVTLAQLQDRVTLCDTVTMTMQPLQRELQDVQNKF